MLTFLYGLNRHMAPLSAVSRPLVHMTQSIAFRCRRNNYTDRVILSGAILLIFMFVFVWIGYSSSFAACSQHSSGMFGQLHSPNLSLHNVMALAKTVPCDISPVRNKFSDILHQ